MSEIARRLSTDLQRTTPPTPPPGLGGQPGPTVIWVFVGLVVCGPKGQKSAKSWGFVGSLILAQGHHGSLLAHAIVFPNGKWDLGVVRVGRGGE